MFDEIQRAADRISGHAHVTPVLTSRTLDRRIGAEVVFKCENLQQVGAFKFRGAFNAISKLTEKERQRGVITFSSGNHAQAVARVGQMLGVGTVVVMPADAPRVKRNATEGYGARVIDYDPAETTREAIARRLQAEKGYTLIPPFDHPDVIAGQGTAALELFEKEGSLDALLVPCGGGGLLSGSAIAARGAAPGCRVIGIEPETADDATRSFHTGTLHTVHNPPTIADGTRTPSLGKLTFPLVLEYVADMKTVPERAIAAAVEFFYYRMKLVVEPSGALGLAALLNGDIPAGGKIGVLVSGGNMDAATLIQVLELLK